MANRTRFAVLGCKETDRAMREVGAKVSNQVVRSAMRDAAKTELAPEVARLIPEGETGKLEHSVKVRSGKRSRNGISVVVAIDVASLGAKSFYGAFRELGTKLMVGAGFMRRALANKGQAAKDRAIAGIRRGLEDAIRSSRK